MRKHGVMLVAVCVLAAACQGGVLDRPEKRADTGPIVLGMLIPESGSEAAIGPFMRNGAQLAIDEINATGGVLGRKLQLRTADDACEAQTAVAGANKLAAEGTHISIGGYCSGATLPTLPVFGRAGIPMIIPAANSTQLADQRQNHVFMINGTGVQQARAARAFLAKRAAKRVAIMHDNTSYAKDIADRTAEGLAQPTTITVTPKENDYAANIATVLRAAPDFVYWTGYFQDGGLIIRQLRQAGYQGGIMVADGSVSGKLIEVAGGAAEGVHATMTPTHETLAGADDWIARYRQKFGSDPGSYSTQSYDAVRLAAEAVRAGGSTNGDKVIAALEGLRGFPMFSGPLTFTPDHTLSAGGFQILVVRGGRFALADPLK